MNASSNMDIDTGIPANAVSVVGDGTDDFPVLKAFQQYIDAEQNKARKRMITLCIFFSCLMTVIIIVFLLLLNVISQRNQALSDRLIEYVIKDRDRQSAVVVQSPSSSDHSAMFLTSKIEEMQKKLEEARQKAEAIENVRKEEAARAATDAAIKAANEKARVKEELEVARLKAQLAVEREKAAAEREKKRQAEIEAYRRKYYPELYETPKPMTDRRTSKRTNVDDEAKADAEIDNLLEELNDKDAIRYFEDEDDDRRPQKKTKAPPPLSKDKSYSIPVEVKGTRSNWIIPND